MASRKNKWRRRGRFEFKRESARYSDDSFTGYDNLWIRIKGKAASVVQPFDIPSYVAEGKTVSLLLGTYRIVKPTQAPALIREYLLSKEKVA